VIQKGQLGIQHQFDSEISSRNENYLAAIEQEEHREMMMANLPKVETRSFRNVPTMHVPPPLNPGDPSSIHGDEEQKKDAPRPDSPEVVEIERNEAGGQRVELKNKVRGEAVG
jgi:hypothetical protein